jgi:hypothetical protein
VVARQSGMRAAVARDRREQRADQGVHAISVDQVRLPRDMTLAAVSRKMFVAVLERMKRKDADKMAS